MHKFCNILDIITCTCFREYLRILLVSSNPNLPTMDGWFPINAIFVPKKDITYSFIVTFLLIFESFIFLLFQKTKSFHEVRFQKFWKETRVYKKRRLPTTTRRVTLVFKKVEAVKLITNYIASKMNKFWRCDGCWRRQKTVIDNMLMHNMYIKRHIFSSNLHPCRLRWRRYKKAFSSLFRF